MRINGYTLAFERRDEESMIGTPIVVYRVMSHTGLLDGEIRVTASGVRVCGRFPTMNAEECVTFEEALARARVQAQSLADRGVALSDAECDRILEPIPFEQEES